jgi:hypothetical protein
MFLLLASKTRQALTLLATIENDLGGMKTLAVISGSGAAHDFRGGLYRPASDKRSAGGTKGKLNSTF